MSAAGEDLLEEFETAWRQGSSPAIADFLPADADARRPMLEDLIKLDLEYRWRRGPAEATPWRLEDYVARHPELGPVDRLPGELIGEEYLARHRWGDRPGQAEYLARFPKQAAVLPGIFEAIDAELQSEFAGKRRAAPGPGSAPEIQVPAGPAQPLTCVTGLIEVLQATGLLSNAQLGELDRELRPRFADLRALAREMLVRDWLTPYQVNQILQGRGPDLVLGPYVLLERLGSGSTGWVFKARHRHLQRLVALKVLRRELLSDTEVVARFYREIRGVSQLSHPHVIHAYDAGPIGRSHVLIMEYAPGIDLARLVQQAGPLPVAHACAYVCQAALGLQHIHERGLVHRDVKPSNLLLVNGGETTHHAPRTTHQIKILDLGLARLGKVVRGLAPGRLLTGGSSASLTPSGAVMMGTPDFLAPEQAIDFRQADQRADIYSLGCTLFFLLTGQPPFPGGSVARKLLLHHHTAPPALEQVRADVPAPVAEAVCTMLAKDPAERFPTAAAVVEALAATLPDELRAGLHQAGGPNESAAWPAPLLAPSGKAWLEASSSWELPQQVQEAIAQTPPASLPKSGSARRRRPLLLAVPLGLLLVAGALLMLLFGLRGPAEQAQRPTRPVRPPASARVPAVDFARGFASDHGLVLNGASISGGRLHLTEPGTWKAGTVFTSQKVDVGQFTTDFRFQLPAGRTTDGLTFTIQTAGTTVVGPPGGGLGYGPPHPGGERGIPRSVAVKFDYWNNHGEGDSSTGLYLNGVSPTVPATDLAGTGIDLRTDHIFRVEMTYDGDHLKVKLSDEKTRASASDTYKVDIPRLVGSFTAHVGFTGSSGGTNATPDILSWVYVPE
jgi:serine/threonine protein kinase